MSTNATPHPAAAALLGPVTYQAAFDAWLSARQGQGLIRLASSIAVYRAMWEAFTQWGVAHELALDALQATDIERFLASRAPEGGVLSDRYAWRWLSLIDAVVFDQTRSIAPLGNRAAAEVLAANPQWQYANATDRDPLPEHLSGAEARKLVVWLLDDGAGYQAAGARAGSWQALRNRCAAALSLGAGLTPGDLRVVTRSSVALGPGRGTTVLPLTIQVPAHGAVAERVVPIAPWAAKLLSAWLARLTVEAIPGEVLFPGTGKGKAWAKVPQYEALRSVLEAAGLGAPGRSGFVLRHTFALRQLRRGHRPEDVAGWLGVTDPGVMARYQRVVFDPPPPA